LQTLAPERRPHLREPFAFFRIDVVLDALDQHPRLAVEPLFIRLHDIQLGDEEVCYVVLLVGPENVLLQGRRKLSNARTHDLVLDVGMGREQSDLLGDLAPPSVAVFPVPSYSRNSRRIALCSSLRMTMASLDTGLPPSCV
jgi:hypothetical protein